MAEAQPTPRLPLFYKDVAPLNKEKHASWYLEAQNDFFFSKNTNCVYIAGVEFPMVAREYPIVFASEGDGTVFPVALLGLQNEQNLFVDEKGGWKGLYVPAYIRRYPFILAKSEDKKTNTVCIDESFAGFNTVKEGAQLFTDKGDNSELLENSVNFLKEYDVHVQWTTAFCAELKALDVMESMNANVTAADGKTYSVSGLLVLNKAKLKALGADKLKELVDKDYLDLIYAHLHSLANLQNLSGRMTQE